MRIRKVLFSKSYFVVGLCVWCLLNTVLYISASPAMQYVPIIYAVWAILILFNECFVRKELFFKFNAVGYSILFVISVILSFVFNGFIAPVKNIYTILAVAINFMLIYTVATEDNVKKTILHIARTVTITVFIFSAISLLLLYFRVSIPLGAPKDQLFIGIDIIHDRYTGIAGNPNGLSRMSLCGIIAAITIMVFDDFKIKSIGYKIFIYCSIIINAITILLTQSRGTTLSLEMGIICVIIFGMFFKVRTQCLIKKISGLLLAFILSAMLIVSIGKAGVFLISSFPYYGQTMTQDGSTLKSRYDKENGLLEDNISNGRFTLMKNGINATIKKNILFGLTYGKVDERVKDYIQQENIKIVGYLYDVSGMMHNTIVQSFANYGLVGLFSLILFLFYIVKVFIRTLCIKNYTRSQTKALLLFIFIFSSLAMLNMVEAVFYFDFDNHLINLILMLSFGLFICFVKKNFGETVVSDKLSSFLEEKIFKLICFISKVCAPKKHN